MKRTFILVLSLALLSGAGVSAQPPGGGASNGSQAGKKNEWQSWIFAGGAVAAAATGLIMIAVTGGSGQITHAH